MNRLPKPTGAVYRSDVRRECNTAALVLQAAGIEHEILRAAHGFVVVVASMDTERAVVELDAYAREIQDAPPPPATLQEPSGGWCGVFVYAGVLLLITFLQARRAFSSDWFASGMAVSDLIRDGQWWRTVTALSLHTGMGHLVGNLIFGGLFGLFAGRLLGSGLAWVSILAAGALGNAMNAWIQPIHHSSVGASTAVFGALGLLSSVSWMQRRGIEDGWIRRWTPIVGGVLLLGYTGTAGERTDVIAHVTGFMSGLMLGVLYSALGRRKTMRAPAQFLLGSTALGALAFCWLLALRPE